MTRKIEPVLRSNLLALVRAYARITGKSVGGISFLVYNDGKFFGNLVDNKTRLTARAYDNAVAWFTKNWPKGETMPALIDHQHKQKVTTNGTKTTTIRSRKESGESRKGGQAGQEESGG